MCTQIFVHLLVIKVLRICSNKVAAKEKTTRNVVKVVMTISASPTLMIMLTMKVRLILRKQASKMKKPVNSSVPSLHLRLPESKVCKNYRVNHNIN